MSGPEVTQADREAAAKCHEKSCYEIVRIQGVQCRNGYADGDYLVQAFARHRTAATEPLEAQIAVLVEAVREIARLETDPDFLSHSQRVARAALAKIAAMKGDQ